MRSFVAVIIISLCSVFLCQRVSAQAAKENLTFIIKDSRNVIPIRQLSERKIAVVMPSSDRYQAFAERVGRYAEVTKMTFEGYSEGTKFFNTIVIVGHPEEIHRYHHLIQQSVINHKDVVLCWMGGRPSAYMFDSFAGATQVSHVEQSKAALEDVAMTLFGGVAVRQGDIRRDKVRIAYGSNSFVNDGAMASLTQAMDAIAEEAIREKATPGLVVMAVQHGKVLFEKAYGYHTYAREHKTQLSDLFDLASISKIAGTTPVVMRLFDQGLLDLDQTIGYYLQQAQSTNKRDISLRTVLLHEAGFTPFIPFYRDLKPEDMSRSWRATHQVQLADSAFLRNNYYEEVMWPEMLHSKVAAPGKYVYSDISMYVMKEVAEHATSVPLSAYADEVLYRPMGMKTAGYLPRSRFDRQQIVPTQYDTVFRKTLLQGFVHDEGAAMAGGVAGHAGLFSSANDLAMYGQLLLNRGTYGGERYFDSSTVDLFTSRQSKTSRRGLGFDRFDPESKQGYPSKRANASVYGHTGYTGTCIWIDPENQLIYIFLSNRVHPQVSSKIGELNTRGRMLDAIYEYINNN